MRALALTTALLSVLELSGCAPFPTSVSIQDATTASLYFPATSKQARVFIDGADAGDAATFDGKHSVLTVEPGTHHIVIRLGTQVTLDQMLFVGAGSRVAVKGQ